MSFVRKIKDLALQAGAKHYANDRIQKYGLMTNLQIDSANNTIHFELLLKGEQTPVTGSAKYQVTSNGEKKLLEFSEIQTSREWINLLMQDFLKTRSVELPEGLPTTIAKLLL
ncbi:MAG: hypothetical protein ACXWKG_20150 [Limisphaerales bacterium]